MDKRGQGIGAWFCSPGRRWVRIGIFGWVINALYFGIDHSVALLTSMVPSLGAAEERRRAGAQEDQPI